MTSAIPSTLVAGATTSNVGDSVSCQASSSEAAVHHVALEGALASSASSSASSAVNSVPVDPRAVAAVAAIRAGKYEQAFINYANLSMEHQGDHLGPLYRVAQNTAGNIGARKALEEFEQGVASGRIKMLTDEEARAADALPRLKPGDEGYDDTLSMLI